MCIRDSDYIHRVGRTARGGKSGRSLLFLLPSELGFLRFLKVAKVPLNEYSFPANKIANVQGQLEKLISKNYYLHQSAKEGYRSYIQAYGSYSLKRIFDINALDLVKVGKAFGFSVPPKVNVSIGTGLKSQAPKKAREEDEEEEDTSKRQRVDRRSYSKHGKETKHGKVKAEMYRQHHNDGKQWSR